MKKLSLLFVLLGALSFTVVTAMPTPAEAAKAKSSKKSKSAKKSSKTKVTVQKSAPSPVSVTYFNNCVGYWGPFAVVGAVGCGAVFAVPVIVESIFWRPA